MLEEGNDEIDGIVFNHRNNPDLPDDTLAELTEEGIGVLDWGTELTWDLDKPSDNRQEAAKRSFDTVHKLNEYGGYGVMHTEGFKEVAIGRVEPPCIRFLELENVDEKFKQYKAFQFDTYSTVDVREDFPAVHDFVSNRAFMETLQSAKEKEENETSPRAVIDAYVELDLSGKLRPVDYEQEYGP